MELIEEKYLPDDVMLHMVRGERMPTTKEQWTLARNIRRTLLKTAAKARKEDWEYESDDDEGEYLGDNQGNEDLDEEATGELDAAAGGDKEKDKAAAATPAKKEEDDE